MQRHAMKISIVPMFVAAVIVAGAQACVPLPPPAEGEVFVEYGPPAAVVEVIAVAPGPDFVWIAGYYRWEGSYVWVPGRWERGPRPGAAWAPGRWVRAHGRGRGHGGGWYWVPGHWR